MEERLAHRQRINALEIICRSRFPIEYFEGYLFKFMLERAGNDIVRIEKVQAHINELRLIHKINREKYTDQQLDSFNEELKELYTLANGNYP